MSDKKRSKEFGGTEAFSRIKKEVAKEMKGLGPEERILVLGCSSAPHLCVKKDEKALISFFDKHIYLPLPDYASRLVGPLCCIAPPPCTVTSHAETKRIPAAVLSLAELMFAA